MIDDSTIAKLEARMAKLEQEITAIPFYARKIEDLEAENKRLSGLMEEVMAALERAGIPRWPNGKPRE